MNVLSDIGRLRLIGLGSAALTVLLIGLGMLSPIGKKLAMPGELRSFHAPLREDCTRCHEASASSIQSVFGGLAATHETRAQSNRCLVCHEAMQAIDQPHGLTEMASSAIELHQQCATCHHEHQGRNESLVALTNAQCQACHSAAFDSFEHGHPEFSAEYGRRTSRIEFDHKQHLREYLPERGLLDEASCAGCHTLDAGQSQMLTRSFEASCAACHQDEVLGSKQVDGRGLTVLGLPALDLMTLEDSGFELGAWPADAEFCETPLSPFLAVLLSVDPEARAELAAYRELDALDLQEASVENQEVVLRIAWRVKGLCAELLREGHAGLETRLERLAGRTLDPSLLVELCGGLSSEVASAAIQGWFPELERELMQYSTGEPVPPCEEAPLELGYDEEAALEDWVDRGGWYRQHLDPSLRYRPRGHEDSFVRAWIEFTHELAMQDGLPEAQNLLGELSMPDTAGLCAKCHSYGSSSEPVRWEANRTRLGVTHFEHGTHMPMVADQGCVICHELEEAGSEEQFLPLSRSKCLECHGQQGASDACTTCHDYHVSGTVTETRQPSLSERISQSTER